MEKNSPSALLAAAKTAQNRAYSPYSNFKVGAAILSSQEHIYSGCNVENAAYPLGQCAEASAIASMIVNGDKNIDEILILSPTEQICPPCGGCRQKIQEFSHPETLVHMSNNKGEITTLTMAEILPLAFKL